MITRRNGARMGRRLCLCCLSAPVLASAGGRLAPPAAFAQAQSVVETIKTEAGRSPIRTHRRRHGAPVGTRADLRDYRDMLVGIRARTVALKRRGCVIDPALFTRLVLEGIDRRNLIRGDGRAASGQAFLPRAS